MIDAQKQRRDWGRICVVARLEKAVENQFFHVWTELLLKGLRPGDSVIVVKDRVAHIAANEGARAFLESDCDTAFFIDSDCDIAPNYLEEMRSLEDEWAYDILQGFYTRRGWPPEAVWFKDTALGDIMQCYVFKDNFTEDTAYVGLHNTLIRREVFETMLDRRPEEVDAREYTWFYYPRNANTSEDATFSFNARQHGFRVGSTTKVKAGHIGRVTTGWETYQEWMQLSGARAMWDEYFALAKEVADFTGEPHDLVTAKSIKGWHHTQAAWQRLQPETVEEVRDFYGDPENGYLYDLLAWNVSPSYHRITAPLKEIQGQRVLVVGAGLGGEVDRLKERNEVHIFEMPGVLREFLKIRYPPEFLGPEIWDCDSLLDVTGPYDLIVAIDVIEHIHPDELLAHLDHMQALLKPTGTLYLHNNFGNADLAPQHFNMELEFSDWCIRRGFVEPDQGWGFYERITDAEAIRA